MKEHLPILIDDKNTDLWHQLSELYEIELTPSTEQNYSTHVSGNIATISMYENELSAASFTHELLHLYLKSKNVKIVEDFHNAVENSEKINALFSDGLKEHVTTCLEHELMRPIFVQMGYEKRFFTNDFNVPKMTKKMLDILLKRYQHNDAYDREAIDFYIGTFFAMKSCINTSFNYHKYYIAFQNLDNELYTLLSEFWLDWKTYNFEDDADHYDKILRYFIEDMNGWISEKVLINKLPNNL